MDEPSWLFTDDVDEDDESCPICGDADGDCDCEELWGFVGGDNSLFYPDETEEEFLDHED